MVFSPRRAHRLLSAWLGVAVVLLTLACSSSSGDATKETVAPAVTATEGAGQEGWRTPVILPVTPGPAPDYKIVDPAFEALPGARAFFGFDDSPPAPHSYQVEVPDAWNGTLVLFAHGFRGNGNELTVGPPPIREHLIESGFAWAASSYAENGYRPGIGARDTARLPAIFASLVGTPERTLLYGQSMGGNVVTISLESAEFKGLYDGALTECGAMTGTGIVDYFLSWGALAGYLTGADLTDVAVDAGDFVITLRDVVSPALGSPEEPTARGRAFANAILHLTGGPRPFFEEGFAAQYTANFGILFGAIVSPSPANAVAQNANTEYTVDEGLLAVGEDINQDITRVSANPDFTVPDLYPEFAPTTGDIDAPLLSLHNTGDLFVPIHLEQEYRRILADAGAETLLVQRAIARPGHCAFSEGEREQAFDDLVNWVETGQVPEGDDLRGDIRDVGAKFTEEGR